jgi:hypothetical protein
MMHLRTFIPSCRLINLLSQKYPSFFSESEKSYENRKAAKRLQKENDIFKVGCDKLIER